MSPSGSPCRLHWAAITFDKYTNLSYILLVMSSTLSPSPPTGLVPRFAGLIGAVKRALGESFSLHQMRVDGNAPALAPLFLRLFDYLTATQRRFAPDRRRCLPARGEHRARCLEGAA